MVWPHLRRRKLWLVIMIAYQQARKTAPEIETIPTLPDEP